MMNAKSGNGLKNKTISRASMLCAILCLVFFMGVVMADAEVSISSYSISPSVVRPGTSGSVSVTFSNTGNSVAGGMTIYYGALDGTAGTWSRNAGDLTQGTQTTIVIPFTVPADANSGTHTLPIDIFFTSSTGSGSGDFTIPVTVSTPPIIQVVTNNLNTKEVNPGAVFDESILLNNTGGPVTEVTLTVPDNASFQLSGESEYVIPSLQSDSSVSIPLEFISQSTLSTGVYPIPLVMTYTDSLGNTSSENVNIGPVDIEDLSTLLGVTATPISDADVGSTVGLNITISNYGNENQQGVFVEPSATTYTVPIGSTSTFFGTIPANGSVSEIVSLGIDPTATTGYYSVPLTVYLSTGQSFNTSIGLLLQAASQVSITSATTPSPMTPGSTGTLTVTIANIGDSTIRSMVVDLSSKNVSITNGQETFIGTLNVDDTGTAVATVRASASPIPANNAVTAEITFKDSNNQLHTVDQTIFLTTSATGAVSGSSTTAAFAYGNGTYRRQTGITIAGIGLLPLGIGAVIIIVVLYLVYRWWKGKKHKKQDRTVK